MLVKTLAGELLELPESGWEQVVIDSLPVEDRPFARVSLHEDLLFVEMEPIAAYMHPETFDREMWWRASACPAAILFLEQNLEKVDWHALSGNSAAGHLLRENLEKVDWYRLSGNESAEAIQLLSEYPDKIVWSELCCNEHPAAVELMRRYPEQVDWELVCSNTNLEALELVKERLTTHPDDISWFELTCNEAAVEILLAHPDKIQHRVLHYNHRSDAVCDGLGIPRFGMMRGKRELSELLHPTPNWYFLSSHPEAGELLFANPDKVDIFQACYNPCVYRKVN